MEKVLPCPFCGGSTFSYGITPHTHHLAYWLPDYEGGGFVECPVCGAAMSGESEAEAVRKWNQLDGVTAPEGWQLRSVVALAVGTGILAFMLGATVMFFILF